MSGAGDVEHLEDFDPKMPGGLLEFLGALS
jgi:hypothetical protein